MVEDFNNIDFLELFSLFEQALIGTPKPSVESMFKTHDYFRYRFIEYDDRHTLDFNPHRISIFFR